MRRLFSAIAKAIMFVCRVIDGVLCMFMPPQVDTADEPIEDPATDAREDLIAVKRWAAAMIRRQQPADCTGRYAAWLRALDRECAVAIAKAAASGRLEAHLSGLEQFKGLPPVLGTEDTRSWLRERAVARRRAAQVNVTPALDRLQPRTLTQDPRLRRQAELRRA